MVETGRVFMGGLGRGLRGFGTTLDGTGKARGRHWKEQIGPREIMHGVRQMDPDLS